MKTDQTKHSNHQRGHQGHFSSIILGIAIVGLVSWVGCGGKKPLSGTTYTKSECKTNMAGFDGVTWVSCSGQCTAEAGVSDSKAPKKDCVLYRQKKVPIDANDLEKGYKSPAPDNWEQIKWATIDASQKTNKNGKTWLLWNQFYDYECDCP